MSPNEKYEAVIIGSGFGGAITGCRLSKRWPGKVLIMERGKRYPMGSFPRKPHDFGRNFWRRPDEAREHSRHIKRQGEMHGMFDIRNYSRMDVVLAAGWGGGSLIYANIFLEPPDEVFDERWPATCKKDKLSPYFKIAKEVLGARPIPEPNGDERRRILKTERFQEAAQKMGRNSELLDINVFFGNDFDNPLPLGQQDKNQYGAIQTSCVYCAECDVGCNYHAKNTLDLNYLFVAENRYDAKIWTEHLAEKIVPVNDKGEDDSTADGEHGYKVYYRDLNNDQANARFVLTNRVVVSSGSLGSTEMLLRCKEVFKTLPRISNKLGHNYSGNGDFLSFVLDTEEPADPNYGPVITQRIDFNLFDQFNKEHAFIVEDAGYPAFAAWLVEGLKPRFFWGSRIWRLIQHTFKRWVQGRTYGSITYALRDLLGSDLSYNTCVLLSMGIDKSDGIMSLNKNKRLDIDWRYKNSISLYDGILDATKEFAQKLGAKAAIPLPTWLWPSRNNVTVHSLGGCILGDELENGVTSADPATFGQVFNYKGLYVADGAIVPTAVGANPIATISALSEMVAEGITGIKPDAKL